MRVVVLGAGASKPAGYPLAGELLPAIGENIQPDAWARWRAFCESCEGPFRRLLENPNPEVVFSVLDLYEIAKEAEFADRMRRHKRGEQVEELDPNGLNTLGARVALLDCLEAFFALKHVEDLDPATAPRRDYLRRLLDELDAGDRVITLNWDTIVERTLAEGGRWNPTTGYGIKKPLALGFEYDKAVTEPRITECDIYVLKLHGSFGWYRTAGGLLYFEGPEFLRFLPDASAHHPHVPWCDPMPPPIGRPTNPLLLHPSFLKQLAGSELQEIWAQADAALRAADSIRVVGYSLPPADSAVRALLNTLRWRGDRGEATIYVSDPNAEARRRWSEFLGSSARIDGEKLG